MQFMEMPQTALIKSVKAGDRKALAEIMDRYVPLVSRTSFRILCDRKDSEHVTVAVFCRLWTYAGEYDLDTDLSVWLLEMTCRLCRLRMARRHFLSMLDVHPELYVTSEPLLPVEEDYMDKQAWELYCRASSKLTALQRILFTLVELEGLEEEQVRLIVGVWRPRLRTALKKARGCMIAEMHKYDIDHEDVPYQAYIGYLRRMAVLLTDAERLKEEVFSILDLNVSDR